jgi:outer membrane protein TolC
LELKFQASKSAEIAAQKQGLPKIGLGLDYVVVSERDDINLNDNGKDILMPMLSFSLPIFRSKYKASVKEAQLMQQSYKYQQKEIANSLISNYEEVWFEIQQQMQYLNLYNQQTKTLEIALNLQFTSYKNSGREFEEVLVMQQQLLKYQKLKAEAMTKYQIAIAKLNYLTSKEY